MATVETLIDNRMSDIVGIKAVLDIIGMDLRSFAEDGRTGLFLPGIKNADGTVTSAYDIANIIYPIYAPPTKPSIPTPVYEHPASSVPNAPDLLETPSISTVPERSISAINTSDLFQDQKPIVNLPTLSIDDPNLHIADYLQEIDGLLKPVLSSFNYPAITPLQIDDIDDVVLPQYAQAFQPDRLSKPVDYAEKFAIKYEQLLPEMQIWVDSKAQEILNVYAPGFAALQTKLESSLSSALSREGVLPDQFENAIYIRAKGRIETGFAAEERDIRDRFEKSGMLYAPGQVTAGIMDARLKAEEAKANQATDIYIERTRQEIQFYQFAIQQANSLLDGLRGFVINYASSILLNEISQSANIANTSANLYGRIFEHESVVRQTDIAILGELRATYDAMLKAALSQYENTKIRLELAKTKTDIEVSAIEAIDKQSQAEYRDVQRYTAMVEAIERKANISEKQLNVIDAKGRIFKYEVDGVLAAKDVYTAGIEGDSKLLQGRLAPLEVVKAQLEADKQKLATEQALVESISKANASKIASFEVGKDVYKLESEIALQKFLSLVKLKELGEEVYSQELQNAISEYTGKFNAADKTADTQLKARQLSVDTALKEADIYLKNRSIGIEALSLLMRVYGGTLESAYSAMSATLAKTIEAAA